MTKNIFWSAATFILSVALWSLMLTKFESVSPEHPFHLTMHGWIIGIKMSLALWLTVLVHEYGHFYAARLMGFRFTHPIYIGIGAFVKPESKFEFLPGGKVKKIEYEPKGMHDVVISMGGPVVGLIFAIFTGLLYLITDEKLFMYMTAIGFTLNMLNLLPLFPLDGGRVMNRLHPGYVGTGTLASIPVVWFWNDPLLWFVGGVSILFAVVQGVGYWLKETKYAEMVLRKDRARVAAIYAGVFGVATAGYLLLRYVYTGPIILA